MSESLPSPSLDADGRLAEDIACKRCGYNLRGMLPDQTCPECGAAVQDGLDAERFERIRWLRWMCRGMGIMVLSLSLVLVSAVPAIDDLRWLGVIWLSLLSLGAAVGVWIATMTPPPNVAPDQWVTRRWIVRVCVLILPTEPILGVLVVVILPVASPALESLAVVAVLVWVTALAVGAGALCMHLAGIAAYIGLLRLAQCMSFTILGLPIGCLASAAFPPLALLLLILVIGSLLWMWIAMRREVAPFVAQLER